MFEAEIEFIKKIYGSNNQISLHSPNFSGNEKKYLSDCIDSTFVSSVGNFVDKFEKEIAQYTGSKFAVATTNGTSALHIALLLANVQKNDEVITQPLSFVATCNAINYCGANPIFLDVERDSMGLSPLALNFFLKTNTTVKNNQCVNNFTNRVIKACVPVHTFGHPCRVDEIKDICYKNHISLIEDAAESLGSFYKNKHTGTFGKMGVISFNGNKIITAGGGGCIITDNEALAIKAKHLSSTAKVPHKWEFKHDQVGYNYRMPNLNAALIVAQLEQLNKFLQNKRLTAKKYKEYFMTTDIRFVSELKDSKSNYWLNTLIFKDIKYRDLFLSETNKDGVMTRPAWTLMNKLSMFKDAQCGELANSEWLEKHAVNIPSSVTKL